MTVLVVGVVDGFLQRDPRVSSSSERLYRRPASVWRESAVNAREGIPRFDQATDEMCAQLTIPRAYFTYEQKGQPRSEVNPFFGSLRKGSQFFGLILKASMVGFTLLSRSYYTICVDEVLAPRSRPTTVRQGNGGL